jgi:hypothetical protein
VPLAGLEPAQPCDYLILSQMLSAISSCKSEIFMGH